MVQVGMCGYVHRWDGTLCDNGCTVIIRPRAPIYVSNEPRKLNRICTWVKWPSHHDDDMSICLVRYLCI